VNFLLDHDVPDDVVFSLKALGHRVHRLRELASRDAADEEVLRLASEMRCVLVSCNRDDFLALVGTAPHFGIIILIRRRSRMMERSALVRLLDSAGPEGIEGNVNFA
jgi:predicted nuclease of predicted toxin-antitoxin system